MYGMRFVYSTCILYKYINIHACINLCMYTTIPTHFILPRILASFGFKWRDPSVTDEVVINLIGGEDKYSSVDYKDFVDTIRDILR